MVPSVLRFHDSSILCSLGILANEPDFTMISLLLTLVVEPVCSYLYCKNLLRNEISKLCFSEKDRYPLFQIHFIFVSVHCSDVCIK